MKKIILLFCGVLSTCALAQWTDNYSENTLVSGDTTSDISSIGTDDGKTYIIYWDETAGYVLKAQLLDADGNQLFGANGIIVNNTADMSTWTATRDEAVDAEGNAYISFTATGDGHGYANKISPTGDQLWGAAGIDLGQDAYDTKVLPDGTGGAIIGWYVNGLGNLMRYDANGNPVWDAVKVLNSPDSSNPFTSVGELALLPDGSFIVFMHVKGTSWMINSIFWAQRFAADGTPLWANAVQVSNQTTAFNRRYEVLQDGDVTYLGYYGSTGFRFDSFLQRVNADGTLPWGINGSDFRTDDTHYEMTTSIAMEEGSDYIWAISDVTNDTQGMYGEFVQKFDKTTGARMLTDNAKQVFPINNDSYIHVGNLQLVDDKPFFLGSTGIGDGVNPLQLFVSYLDENGDFAWDDQYIEIATTATAKYRVDFTKNVAGQSVAVWVENRGSGTKAYAQNYKIETVPEEDCDPVDVPYTQDFETAVPPDMPECTSVENAGSGNNWETASGDEYGFTGTHLRYHWNVDNAANTWFFTHGINMQAGVTYKISYDYGSAGQALYSENLKVAYGVSAESGAMNTTIADHPGILTGTLVSNTVEFEVDEDGVYYFGFNAYSDADMFYLFLDNIHIEVADEEPEPGCSQEFTGDPDTGVGIIANSGADYRGANDFKVEAGMAFTLETISIDFLTDGTYDPNTVDVYLYGDSDGSGPAGELDSFMGLATDLTPNGELAGFTRYTLSVTLPAPHTFEGGTEGASFWVGLTVPAPDESVVAYWVASAYVDNGTWAMYQSADGGVVWTEVASAGGGGPLEGDMTVTGQCEQLGISDMTSFDFAYYPNPVKDVLNISSGKTIENVTAYNLAGQSVLQSAKVTNGQINVSALPAGVYVFRVTLQGGQIETFKIVKK